eukprot:Awhi_evm1s5209
MSVERMITREREQEVESVNNMEARDLHEKINENERQLKERFLNQLANGETITNKEEDQDFSVVKDYQRVWGWVGFFTLLLFVTGWMFPFYTYELAERPVYTWSFTLSQWTVMKGIQMVFYQNGTLSDKQSDFLLKNNITSAADLQREMDEYYEVHAHVFNDFTIFWKTWFIVGFVNLAYLLFLIVFICFQWHHPIVQGKSRIFLWQVAIASVGTSSGMIYQKVYVWYYYTPNQEEFNNFWGWLFVLFFGQMFETALFNKMRLINAIFSSAKEVESKNKIYIAAIPFQVILFIITIFPLAMHFFTSYPTKFNGFEISFFPTGVVMFVIYPLCIVYYIIKCREVATQFNDYYSNLRVVIYLAAVGNVSVAIQCLKPNSLSGGVMFHACISTSIILYLSDTVFCILYMIYRATRKKWNSKNNEAKLEREIARSRLNEEEMGTKTGGFEIEETQKIDHFSTPSAISKFKNTEKASVTRLQSTSFMTFESQVNTTPLQASQMEFCTVEEKSTSSDTFELN